jgi:hypothetical protein
VVVARGAQTQSLVAVMVLISLTPVDLPHASNGIEMTNVRMERDF